MHRVASNSQPEHETHLGRADSDANVGTYYQRADKQAQHAEALSESNGAADLCPLDGSALAQTNHSAPIPSWRDQ